jgi:hypothetical protein
VWEVKDRDQGREEGGGGGSKRVRVWRILHACKHSSSHSAMYWLKPLNWQACLVL